MEPEDTDVRADPQVVRRRPPREVRPPPHLSDYAVDYRPMTEPRQTHLTQEDVLSADVLQLLVVKEEVPPEQEWSSSLDQEDPEPPHIKEEQEDHWTSQEGEQLQGLEEADIIKFTFTPVAVKSEDDEEKPQSLELHQRQTEQMETEADGEDCGGPEPVRNSDPDRHSDPDTEDETEESSEPETDNSDDWKETREPQSGLNSLNNDEVPVSDSRCSAGEKPFSCSVCGKMFCFKHHLKRHMQSHTGEEPFSCSVCKKYFTQSGYLQKHMRIHTGAKPFSCSVCKKYFTQRINLQRHMRIHTGEKPFSCSVCKKSFTQSGNLQTHMGIHTRETPFTCSGCGKRFGNKANLKIHMRTHTGEFSCIVCGKQFSRKNYLVSHMNIHSGENERLSCSVCDKTWYNSLKTHKCVGRQASQLHQSQTEQIKTEADGEYSGGPDSLNINEVPVNDERCNSCENPLSCSECGKIFGFKGHLKRHMRSHTGEKPFSCSVCMKSFAESCSLQKHMKIHTGEKPFSCSVCKKYFTQSGSVQRHMRTHTGEKPFSCSVCMKSFAESGSLKKHMKIHRGETIQLLSV
ncbi:uncharacterized protein LOC141754122 isoform X1 [Sebastes fasciatus]|uniref:uncharacterized protein LOC141754122 isoform X1 n=1 Tax=Sebastes fasciatus TaxID=394691 RepID=UPI003D9DD14E